MPVIVKEKMNVLWETNVTLIILCFKSSFQPKKIIMKIIIYYSLTSRGLFPDE